MKTLKQTIKERLIASKGFRIDEMATIGVFPDGKETYKLSVHGSTSNDRQTVPHLHIYLNNNSHKFDLEFSLIDLLVEDKWIRLRVRDYEKNKRIDNKTKTENWHPYTDVLKMIQKFVFEENYEVDNINYIDPLHYAIVSWNKEYDFAAYRRKENSLLKLIESKGQEVLPKYKKYFN